jgi:hypothetical protein
MATIRFGLPRYVLPVSDKIGHEAEFSNPVKNLLSGLGAYEPKIREDRVLFESVPTNTELFTGKKN